MGWLRFEEVPGFIAVVSTFIRTTCEPVLAASDHRCVSPEFALHRARPLKLNGYRFQRRCVASLSVTRDHLGAWIGRGFGA